MRGWIMEEEEEGKIALVFMFLFSFIQFCSSFLRALFGWNRGLETFNFWFFFLFFLVFWFFCFIEYLN